MRHYTHRELATSLTALTFVIIGVTGVLMYFHLFESRIKTLHEILGLVFVGAVSLHVFFNWKSMRRYFGKQVFISTVIVAAAVSAVFVSAAGAGGANPKTEIIRAVLAAPLDEAVQLLGGSGDTLARLESKGIRVGEATSIRAVADANGISPFKVVQIVTE
jgi:glucan phosphoethanolaminetransferase (alkaline phosphatase superfamily)